jgi:surfactin synthase thioesterase subunit
MTGATQANTAKGSLWLPARARPVRASGATLELFCLPHAGAGATLYRGWGEELPESIIVSPVQLPGRENRYGEAARTSITEISTELALVLAGAITGPYALFGCSMGALIAYETALQLRRLGLTMPAGLVVAAHQPPHQRLARKKIWQLPKPEFLEELRSMGGMPEELWAHPELVEFLLPTLRADFQACDTYRYSGEAPLSIPVAVLGGWNDEHVRPDLLEAWGEMTTQGCTTHMFPGGHFFMKDNRSAMLRTLAKCLSDWQNG